MLKLDNNLLEEIGLGVLPEDQKKAMLQHIYDTLELRVGTQLANQMTDQQLEEFEKFIDEDPNGGAGNQPEALQWLETNLPNYKQVVNDVFEDLKAEIKEMAPQIVASSQQMQDATSAQPPAAGPAAPMADPAAQPNAQNPYGPAAYQPQYGAPAGPAQPYGPAPAMGSQPMPGPGVQGYGPAPQMPQYGAPQGPAPQYGQQYGPQPGAGQQPQYGAGQAQPPQYGQSGAAQQPYQDPGQQAA